MRKLGNVYTTPELIDVLEVCIDTNTPAMLIGETGTGKTALIRELAKKHKKELIRISLNGSTGTDELLGKWLLNDGNTVWQNGILTDAITRGAWVVLDELNACLPEVLLALNALLDDERALLLSEKDNERVAAHEETRFFATLNPTEDYAGTKDLNRAFLGRFIVRHVRPLSPAYETKLVVQRTKIDTGTARELVRIAGELRKAKEREDLFYYCSTRDVLHAALLVARGIKLALAVETALLEKMTSAERDIAARLDIGARDIEEDTRSVDDILAENERLHTERAEQEQRVTELTNRIAAIADESFQKKLDALTQAILKK